MARTQAADYDQRRQAIVQKAASLFARSGFKGTSVADIASECDTSKSLIYHYFPSKEDILNAVMATHVDLLEQDVSTALQAGGEARDRLAIIMRSFMQHYAGAEAAHKVLLNELDSLPERRRAVIVRQQRRIVEAVMSLLTDIFEPLARDHERAWASAMLLLGMINWTHTWYNPNGALDPDAIADMALDMILPGRSASLG